MSLSRFVASVACLVVFTATQSAGQPPPPPPKPGPEHQIFKMDEGTWDAVVEVATAPGAPQMASKGVEVNTIGCSGLCLITDFKGDMGGTPFVGHGVSAWDPTKKKYVSSWTDSMSLGISTGEGTYDAATHKMTGWMEGPDMATGKRVKTRSVGETKGNTRVFTMFGPGPDGKEMQVMKITYTRQK